MILVVNSDVEAAQKMAELVRLLGFDVEIETKPRNVFDTIRRLENDLELIVLELIGEGLEILSKLKRYYPFLSCITSSISNEFSLALQALRSGAAEFVVWPIEREQLSSAIKSVRQQSPKFVLKDLGIKDIVGASSIFLESIKRIQAYASSELPLLILGSPGTGKTLLAHAAASLSSRSENKIVSVDLDTIPPELRGAELFGLGEEGAVAFESRGRLGEANEGTLIIESIHLLSAGEQQNLVRFLRTGTYFDVYGHRQLHSSARLICTDNEKLQSAVDKGKYSADLMTFFTPQLVLLPELRSRPDDIAHLAKFFVRRYSAFHRKPNLVLSDEALRLLEGYEYKGNVRELGSIIQSAVLMVEGFDILPMHFSSYIRGKAKEAGDELQDIYLRTVFRVLAESNGNQTVAAKRLGMARGSLNRMLRRLKEKTKNLKR